MFPQDKNVTEENLARALGDLAEQHETEKQASDLDTLDPRAEEDDPPDEPTRQDEDRPGEWDAPDETAEAAQTPHGAGPQEQEGQPEDEVSSTPVRHEPTMRTLLREFGEEFDADVRPLIGPIRRAADTVAAAPGDWAIRSILPELRELAHQVQVLTDRVAVQQAYVLIFGPLKSGKSTFMNAVCSIYVSEVTALPAYPCLVNVSHAETPGFLVTRYDGHAVKLADQHALHDLVQSAHKELMARVRDVEACGEDFEPAAHMPEAIRKIDVGLDTGDLAESGAVLVDTPGLYSRMKFGYDQMTRDFRNAAACAIFIVKTDNLFLEQVFAEFQELLDLFSRVFLIVNLDVTKRDLAPDGSLIPSLEREDPERIIDAFRDLSLTAPLKAAADAERLRIYPVDLLHAASRRIRQVHGEDVTGEADHPSGQASFDALLTDLTDYLNSNEYLHEFLLDSLRRADTLLGELADVTEHRRVRDLAEEAVRLREDREGAVRQSQAMVRLREVDWPAKAQVLRDRLQNAVQQKVVQKRDATAEMLDAEIRAWFDGEASLRDLAEGALAPLTARARDDCMQFARDEMSRLVDGTAVGLALATNVIADLRAAQIDLGAMGRGSMAHLAPVKAPPAVEPAFRSEDIPVKRRFWDWVLLRSKASVRRRLFGPPNSPDMAIPPATKARRLGERGEETLRRRCHEQLHSLLEEVLQLLPGRLVDDYVGALTGSMADALTRRGQEVSQRIAYLEGRLAEAERILADVQALVADVGRTALSVDTIRERFASPAEDEAVEETLDEAGPRPDEPTSGPQAPAAWEQAAGQVDEGEDAWSPEPDEDVTAGLEEDLEEGLGEEEEEGEQSDTFPLASADDADDEEADEPLLGLEGIDEEDSLEDLMAAEAEPSSEEVPAPVELAAVAEADQPAEQELPSDDAEEDRPEAPQAPKPNLGLYVAEPVKDPDEALDVREG